MKIIRYESHNDIDIEFLDENHYIKKHNTYSNFKNGEVKNPYDKTVYGIGCIGDGEYMAKVNNHNGHEYTIWAAMLNRCYRHKKMFPAYFGKCMVCDEWLNFQTFAKWYHDHEYKVNGRLHLDKDILFPGCNIYSPKTCILVPQRINELFRISTRKKDGFPQGIRKTKANNFSVEYSGKSLGICKTFEEACNKYKLEKERVLKEVAEEYKSIIPIELYNALISYDVKVA